MRSSWPSPYCGASIEIAPFRSANVWSMMWPSARISSRWMIPEYRRGPNWTSRTNPGGQVVSLAASSDGSLV
jgi:hypothetical protein